MGNTRSTEELKEYQPVKESREPEPVKEPKKIEELRYYFKDGVYYFANGNTWTGEINSNKTTGRGILIFKNGDRYEGEVKNGELTGYGVYTRVNRYKYEGEFKHGTRHGFGIHIGFNTLNKKIIYRYEGKWENNSKNGEGLEIIYREDGVNEVCRGTWKKDKKHGFCRTELIDGTSKELFVEGIYEDGYLISKYPT